MQNPQWGTARIYRKYQRLFGRIAGFFLAIALLSLFDGLIAQMRAGSNELEFLPGQAMLLSGPSALKNPLNSDVMARFTPENAPLTFELEGFFTGYWFGNGMWRGKISALPDAEPGEYDLSISFRGASAQSAQKYILLVFADKEAVQAAARSFIRRWFGLNPFIIAAWSGGAGIFFGIVTYFFGRRFDAILSRLGLTQVYSCDGADIWCLAPQAMVPKPGVARMVLDETGRQCGEARAGAWQKGKLALTLMDGQPPPPGALVCLRHPGENPEIYHLHKCKEE